MSQEYSPIRLPGTFPIIRAKGVAVQSRGLGTERGSLELAESTSPGTAIMVGLCAVTVALLFVRQWVREGTADSSMKTKGLLIHTECPVAGFCFDLAV